jgi:lipopolysaccharide biosynthesis glycosyltransferase
MTQSSIKILVGYHKPAQLLKSDILVPIHLGRACATQASKDGAMSEEDYQWMLDNMIGDDTGDNISSLNRYFCELTAFYWAWKNYDKLGNPDYIGFMHYRRWFEEKDIQNSLNFDICAPFNKFDGNVIEKQFNKLHGTNDLRVVLDDLTSKYPSYKEVTKQYLQSTSGFFCNMFIMKKELFLEYCSFLFSLLLPLYAKKDYTEYTPYNTRMPGFIAERLTGIFISQKAKEGKNVLKCHAKFCDVGPVRTVNKAFKDPSINIVFSADDNYAPYLAVAISSIKQNRTKNQLYDICVLDGGISAHNKKLINTLKDERFSIRYIDISGFLQNIDTKIFRLNAHFTIATYYRFFITQIFQNYSRILYLDSDIVVDRNIEELFKTDLGQYALGACTDVEMRRCIDIDERYNGSWRHYLQNVLHLSDSYSYFQAGVLLFDITKLSQSDFLGDCLDRLRFLKEPRYVDQDVLNSLFDGKYQRLDLRWNHLWQIPYYIKDLDRQLNSKTYDDYMSAGKNPYIIHYAGAIKPWKNPEVDLAEVWWKYARQTPVYEEILSQMVELKVGNLIKSSKTANVGNAWTQSQYKNVSSSKIKLRFLGFLPIYKKKTVVKEDKIKTKIYLLGILALKKTETPSKKEIRFLGLPIWKTKTQSNKQKSYLFGVLPVIKRICE